MLTNTPFEALCSCRDKAGSESALARDLGLAQSSVWKWFQSSKRMPAEHVLRAESLYGVSRHDLRPDIYPRNYPPAPDDRFHGVDRRAHRANFNNSSVLKDAAA